MKITGTRAALTALMLAGLVATGTAEATAAEKPIGGKLLKMKTDKEPSKHLVLFKAVKELAIAGIGDPTNGATLLIRWNSGATAGRTEAIELDPALWKGLGNPPGSKGWKYTDKAAARGGVKVLLIKPGAKGGILKILAKGDGFPWDLPGAIDDASVDLWLDDDQYCAAFEPGNGDVKKNDPDGFLLVKDFAAPGNCEEAICGNGMEEAGEDCDDGNLDDSDGCLSDCTEAVPTPSTFDNVQSGIFSAGCATGGCHTGASPSFGLDLSAGNAYAATVNIPSSWNASLSLINPSSGDADDSFLFIKVAAGANGGSYPGLQGGQMPPTGSVSADCLEGLKLWLEAGASASGNVPAADALLTGSCF